MKVRLRLQYSSAVLGLTYIGYVRTQIDVRTWIIAGLQLYVVVSCLNVSVLLKLLIYLEPGNVFGKTTR